MDLANERDVDVPMLVYEARPYYGPNQRLSRQRSDPYVPPILLFPTVLLPVWTSIALMADREEIDR